MATWYTEAKTYWDNIGENIDGMLGGYPEVDGVEIEQSQKLLTRFITNGLLRTGCVCGIIFNRLWCRYW